MEERIKAYLDKRAAEDAQFAAHYPHPEKTIAGCVRYLYNHYREESKGAQCYCASDDEVFGLCVHYFEDDSIKETKPQQAKPAVRESPAIPFTGNTPNAVKRTAPAKVVSLKPAAKPSTPAPKQPAEKKQAVQLELF